VGGGHTHSTGPNRVNGGDPCEAKKEKFEWGRKRGGNIFLSAGPGLMSDVLKLKHLFFSLSLFHLNMQTYVEE
jgi:hypothetical protein